MPGWSEIMSRASGKWQLPLLLLSLIVLSTALLLLRPDPRRMPLDRAAATLRMFREAGDFGRAVETGDAVLDRSDLTPADRAAFHLELARTRFAAAVHNNRKTPNAARTIIHHYRETGDLGDTLDAEDFVRLGQALEWARQYHQAVDAYAEGLGRGYSHAMALRRHVIDLRRDELGAIPNELDAEVDRFLADVGREDAELLSWAIEEKLNLLEELGRAGEAGGLVERFAADSPSAVLGDEIEYLRARALYGDGANGPAELQLRALRNRLSPEDPLVAKTGWLLGRTILATDRPQAAGEALSFFSGVVADFPRGLYSIASRLGIAEAFARLGEHGNALEAYRSVIEELPDLDRNRIVNRDVVRTGLGVLAESLRTGQDLAAALSYAELANELVQPDETDHAVVHVQQVALLESLLADQLRTSGAGPDAAALSDDAEDWRELLTRSAKNFQRLSELEVHHEERSADAAWQAAELFAEAGRRQNAIEQYNRFARTRPQSPLVPRAILRIGQLYQAAGRFSQAITAFQECHDRFPTILDGIRSLVPLAEAYAASPDASGENLGRAEATLRMVLEESEVLTPEAPEFADALFLLGDVLERREQYERAISVLHESLDRYPADSRVWRARFLLAGCYRQSGLNLKGDVAKTRFEGEIDQLRAESRARLAQARAIYRELIDEYEARGEARLSPLEQVYLRHARLYEADCHFEAGEHREALKRYEEAAGLYRDSPSGLAAYVQTIHCHVFLGEPQQARTALARGQVVLDRMDPAAFASRVSPETKSDWQRYFDWLDDSELF